MQRNATLRSVRRLSTAKLGLDATPFVIISDVLKSMLDNLKLSGVSIAEVQVTLSEDFEDLSGNERFPDWYWLKIFWDPYKDDMGFRTEPPELLIVSDRVYSAMHQVDPQGAEDCRPVLGDFRNPFWLNEPGGTGTPRSPRDLHRSRGKLLGGGPGERSGVVLAI